jgi:endonuclease III
MSQESDLREEIRSIEKDIQSEYRNIRSWESQAEFELYNFLQDPTISQNEKDKATFEFRRELNNRYINSIEPLLVQLDELNSQLFKLLVENSKAKETNPNLTIISSEGKSSNPKLLIRTSESGKNGARGQRGEKGEGYSNGFVGSTRGRSGKDGKNSK